MNTPRTPEHFALPPPVELDLIDGGRAVGWIIDDTVGFRGFADETDAAHAAWVAHRTLSRRLALTHGTRPVPVDTEPLALERRGHEEAILASGRPIAVLVRPGAASASGSDSFGFEIRIPPPADELRVRSLANLMYRTLRKSGLRWALWMSGTRRAAGAAESTAALAGRDRVKEQSITGNPNVEPTDVTEFPDRRTWRLPSMPWRRGSRGSRAA